MFDFTNTVIAIASDAKGSIWVGTMYSEAYKFNGSKWTSYAPFPIYYPYKTGDVNSIAIDSQGNEWFGSEKGVVKYDGGHWSGYTTSDGLVSNSVTSIAIDAEDNKWFGTGNGVSKFDGSKWTNYTTSDGLADNVVNAIAIDAQGNKWFGTVNGVSKLTDGSSSIPKKVNENPLQLYPNPVQSSLYIDLSGKSGMLQIHDITGKKILQKQIIENITIIDVSGFESGIYIVRVLSDHQILTKKIVKY
jgi:ligand-binding sensor domain-containing protein